MAKIGWGRRVVILAGIFRFWGLGMHLGMRLGMHICQEKNEMCRLGMHLGMHFRVILIAIDISYNTIFPGFLLLF